MEHSKLLPAGVYAYRIHLIIGFGPFELFMGEPHFLQPVTRLTGSGLLQKANQLLSIGTPLSHKLRLVSPIMHCSLLGSAQAPDDINPH